MAYSDKVLDHYENPRNVGSFGKDDDTVGTGMVGAPACGDVMKLQIRVGADGVIDCFPNVWDEGGQSLFNAAHGNDTLLAARLQATGRRLTDLFTSDGRTLYPSTKAAMDLLGIPGGGKPRTPLRALSPAQCDALAVGLQAEGLL